MNKLVDEAPYHPGYEDAVVTPAPKYIGMNPAKMIWRSKPLTNDEIVDLRLENEGIIEFARAIEERHGIK
jgi:hypothetical protein